MVVAVLVVVVATLVVVAVLVVVVVVWFSFHGFPIGFQNYSSGFGNSKNFLPLVFFTGFLLNPKASNQSF